MKNKRDEQIQQRWCENPKVDPWIWREIIARSGKVAYVRIKRVMSMAGMLQKIVDHMHEIYPIATDKQIKKVLK